jgi:hypothetical protein
MELNCSRKVNLQKTRLCSAGKTDSQWPVHSRKFVSGMPLLGARHTGVRQAVALRSVHIRLLVYGAIVAKCAQSRA